MKRRCGRSVSGSQSQRRVPESEVLRPQNEQTRGLTVVDWFTGRAYSTSPLLQSLLTRSPSDGIKKDRVRTRSFKLWTED